MTEALITRYLALLADPTATADALGALLHPEMRQREWPNALNPRGQESDRADCLRRFAAGQAMLRVQHYTLTSTLVDGDRAVVEAEWLGTMAVDAGPLRAGQTLTAAICMAFELRDGLIWRQRNYDCFSPWA
ncbi:MAG: nuclear transport factor 2 family protein [Myxococcales bacterium]|nr:nuclear transport factor 2 family protein [Myxococcales bacterium]MCB9544621.1 nuclear transport factor 2 family protein [Myxococcales bacterium]